MKFVADTGRWPARASEYDMWLLLSRLRREARKDVRLVSGLDRKLPGWRYPLDTTADED